jgi:hypothetical protein
MHTQRVNRAITAATDHRGSFDDPAVQLSATRPPSPPITFTKGSAPCTRESQARSRTVVVVVGGHGHAMPPAAASGSGQAYSHAPRMSQHLQAPLPLDQQPRSAALATNPVALSHCRGFAADPCRPVQSRRRPTM